MIPKISSQPRTKYDVHILRSQNNESGELELNNIGEKYQDESEIILHNTIIYTGFKKIDDMLQGFGPLSQYSQKIVYGKF